MFYKYTLKQIKYKFFIIDYSRNIHSYLLNHLLILSHVYAKTSEKHLREHKFSVIKNTDSTGTVTCDVKSF